MVFNKLKKNFLLLHCGEILKGLPQWARGMEDDKLDDVAVEPVVEEPEVDEQKEPEVEEEVDDDDYDAVLQKEAIWNADSKETDMAVKTDAVESVETADVAAQ